MRKVYLLFFMMVAFSVVNAQSSANYTFTTTTTGSLALDANSNAVDMSAGTTQLVGPSSDGTVSSVTNIGFQFLFMGNLYSQFSASADGYVGLGATAVSGSTNGAASFNTPKIGALGGDLYVGSSAAGGKVHYKLVGTAPNRCLVVEFKNMAVFYNTTASNAVNTFQVRLYETSGVVEFVYGNMYCGSTTYAPGYVGFSVGSSAGLNASVTTSANTVSTGATFNTNNYTVATNIPNLHSTSDGSRRTYVFTPPAIPAAPTSLTFTTVASSRMTLNWVDNATNELGYGIFQSTDGVNYTLVASVPANTTSYLALGLTPTTTYYWQVFAFTEGTASGPVAGNQSTTASTPPAPLSGIYTINNTQPTAGTNFNNFTDAFWALNDNGLSAGVTFNVYAGQTFTEIVPPLTATGTAANPIIFQKFGSGANPVVQRTDGGVFNTIIDGGQGDGILTLDGSDYVTFDNIDVNATNPAIEYGYFLRKASATDGCKYITIKNASITMARSAGSNPYITGIYSSNLLASSPVGSAAGVTVTSVDGRNESVTITGNTISNVNHGIQLRGYAHTSSPYNYTDTAFTIGVNGAGNVINNWGGTSATTAAYGIYAERHKEIEISYNTINNTANGGVASTGSIYGIYGGASTTGEFTANNNNITLASAYASGSVYGIYNSGFTGNLVINANTVAVNNSVSTSSAIAHIYNASATAATSVSISNNVLNNSAYTSTATCYVIYNSVTNAAINTINNNSISGITKSGSGTLYIYYSLSSPTGTEIFSNNEIYNISNAASSLYGYNSNTATAHRHNVYGNKIYGLSCGGTVYAIYKGLGTGNIYNNKIYDITTTSGSSIVAGIYHLSGVKDSIYNNIIGDLKATTYSGANGVVGIYSSSTSTSSTIGIYYNTILLNATSSGTNFGTSGIYLTGNATATTAAAELKNNLVVNNSIAAGTGKTIVLRRSSTALTNFVSSSNNNLYYTSSGSVFYDGTNEDATLAAYKTRVAPRETASVSQSPAFVSITGADPTYLHINTSTPTQIESGGTPVSGIENDFDGNTRDVTTPDIGADEFVGISTDLTGPAITYTALPVKTICADGQLITATITDASDVNITAGTKPRLWFKKASENDVLPATNTSASNGWKYVEASNSSSPFTFTFDFSLLTAPLTIGDSVSYFIVAQDLATTPNFSATTATFSAAPASVALDASVFPVSGNIKGFSILTLPGSIPIKINSTEICGSGDVTLNLDGVEITGAESQWQSSPAGINAWTDISGATTIPYTTDVLTSSTDFRLIVTCGGTPIASSPSPVVSVVINNPQVTSSTGASRCGPGTLTLTATAPGYDINWYEAPTGNTTIGTGNTFTTPAINATTTYYVAAGTQGAGTFTVGNGSTTSATYSNPFYSLWSNLHVQHLITAAELSAAGLTAGTINSLGIDITNAGTLPMIDLAVKIAHTSASDMTAFVSAPFTTVFTSASYMPTTGLNTMIFTTPFVWDGVSNIVIDICHGNASSSATMSRTALMDPTSYVSTIKTHTSAATGAAAQCGNTTTNVVTYSVRPKFTFNMGCIGARTPVLATINTPPAITANAAPASICEGQSSNLTVSSSNTSYTYSWDPVGSTNASVNVTPSTTTKYYITATDNSTGPYSGCTNIDSVTVTVNSMPSSVSISPSSAAVCAAGGTAVELTTTGGTIDKSYVFGTQAAQNAASTGATGYPAPYTVYYGGQRMQMLVLASELASAGFSTGSEITSINFPVVSLGANWGSTTTSCNSFQVSIGATAATSISAFASGLTQVIAPADFTPTVGYNNVHTFSTPFVWDGTSNLILETTFSNNKTGTTADLVTQYNSPTAYQSCIVYRADGITATAAATATTVSYSYSARPDFTLNGINATSITWSPVTGLYTDASATTAYIAGTHATTVYAKPATATTYTVTATSAANCSSSGTVNVAVTTPPSATIAYTGSPYCNSGIATVTHTGSTGGVYSSTTGLSINASTGDIYLAASTPGTYTVTYTIAASGGCSAYTTTASVTINAAPSATISYPGSPYCIAAGTATVTQTGASGGIYSSTAGLSINATTGEVNLTASTIGTYTVTYTIAASGGCPVYTATASITVATTPAATISYGAGPYCTNGGTATVTQTGSTGGVYSSTTGLSINASTGDIDLAASTPGTYTVTYFITAASGCSSFSTDASITINAAPSATISYAGTPYCSNGGTATVTQTGTTGGTYSSTTGLSIDAATGTINLAASTPGTYTVTYTVPPANGCVVYAVTTSVTITTMPSATISYAGSPYCTGASTATVTFTGTTGGTYSSTTGLSIDATTGTIDIATSTAGVYTVTYTIAAGNGCSAFSTTASVSIVDPPTATISYAGTPYCSNGGTATVTQTGTTGGAYTSTAGLSINPVTGAINLGTSTPGTYTVTYTISGITGCPAFATTASVAITIAPTATISYTGSPYCNNLTTANVVRTGNAGGTYSSSAGLSIDATTGAINIAASTPGTYTVSYTLTGSGGCANFIATAPVVITPAPSATISYPGSPYCGGAGMAAVTQTGTTGGTYSSTNGLSINATTGEIDLAATVPGTYLVTYTVAAANGCAVYTTTAPVTIAALASATISYAGSPYCGNGTTANVTRTGTPGGTYSSTAGLSLNATTGAVNIAASTAGTYTVTYSIASSGTCPAFSTTTSITITTPPSATISYAGTPYCSNGGTATVTQTGTTGGTYSSAAGLSINATTGAINLAASSAGTYTVTYTVAASGGCSVYTTTANVTITNAPSATISYAGSPYCGSSGVATVTQTGTTGGTYSSTAGLSIDAATGAINITTSTPGTYTVSYSVQGTSGCANYTATTTVSLTTPGTWTGLTSTDWNTASNWCGGIPSAATDAIIPSSAPNMPNLSNGSASVKNIIIQSGASVTIGTAGLLELYGNITGAGTLSAANGSINVRGATDQTIPAFTVTNLTINMTGGGASLILGGNSAVTGTLTLTNGNITLGANNLALSSGSSGKTASHIITNGSGNVVVVNLAASQSRTIPVGSDGASYNPVALIANPGHTADDLTVRVQQGVYKDGASGTTFTTHVADRMWIINEAVAGGSNINLTLQWAAKDQLPEFDNSRCYIAQPLGNGEWTIETAAPANGADPYTQTKAGITSLGAFSVQTEQIPRPVTGIYPNPARDYLYVVTDLLSTGPVTFSIYDDKGQLVYRRQETLNVGLNRTRLDIGQLGAGIYVVKVVTRLNDKFLSQRFIKVN